jgi:hypothetical protein
MKKSTYKKNVINGDQVKEFCRSMKINPMAFWWDYTNNYLTVSKIAEYYDMHVDEAQELIELGRGQWDAASIDERQNAIESMPEA